MSNRFWDNYLAENVCRTSQVIAHVNAIHVLTKSSYTGGVESGELTQTDLTQGRVDPVSNTTSIRLAKSLDAPTR